MAPDRLDGRLVRRLHAAARCDRWGLTPDAFEAALAASAAHAFAGRAPARREVERYLESLHLEDLALARACAGGCEAAWEHMVREYRPVLYRSAQALDPGGGARDLADALYAELYGLAEKDGQRRSLFRYFHGRSSLATWLRAVLAQRHVDVARAGRRLAPLPDEEPAGRAAETSDPDAPRYRALAHDALAAAVARLPPRDRLRLGCYYAQQLTLAETGRLLREHEATVSRQLARTRRALRDEVTRALKTEAGLTPVQVARCIEIAAEDAGPLDLDRMFSSAAEGKNSSPDRSE